MKNGIPNYNEIVFTEKEIEEIIKLYVEEKMSTPKIGKLFGCSYQKICTVLDKNGIKRTNNGVRKYKLNENYFDNIDTPNKAYILGLMCADGCNYPPKCTVFISLQESDRKLLEDIRNEIGSEKPLKIVDQSYRNYNGYSYNNMCTLEMYSSHMCKSLEKLGVV